MLRKDDEKTDVSEISDQEYSYYLADLDASFEAYILHSNSSEPIENEIATSNEEATIESMFEFEDTPTYIPISDEDIANFIEPLNVSNEKQNLPVSSESDSSTNYPKLIECGQNGKTLQYKDFELRAKRIIKNGDELFLYSLIVIFNPSKWDIKCYRSPASMYANAFNKKSKTHCFKNQENLQYTVKAAANKTSLFDQDDKQHFIEFTMTPPIQLKTSDENEVEKYFFSICNVVKQNRSPTLLDRDSVKLIKPLKDNNGYIHALVIKYELDIDNSIIDMNYVIKTIQRKYNKTKEINAQKCDEDGRLLTRRLIDKDKKKYVKLTLQNPIFVGDIDEVEAHKQATIYLDSICDVICNRKAPQNNDEDQHREEFNPDTTPEFIDPNILSLIEQDILATNLTLPEAPRLELTTQVSHSRDSLVNQFNKHAMEIPPQDQNIKRPKHNP